MRHACAQPAAQSPGDARTCASSYGGAVGTFVKKYVFGENTPFTNTSRACVEERTQELSGAAERAGGAWVSGLHIYTQSSTVRYSLPRSERRGNETAAECSTARRARSWLVRSGPCSAGSFGAGKSHLLLPAHEVGCAAAALPLHLAIQSTGRTRRFCGVRLFTFALKYALWVALPTYPCL